MLPLVYFVRHGQTDWNAEHRLQGQADIDLNALGRGRPSATARKLAELIVRAGRVRFRGEPAQPHARNDGAGPHRDGTCRPAATAPTRG